jgi:hypothetical protein
MLKAHAVEFLFQFTIFEFGLASTRVFFEAAFLFLFLN